MFVRDDGLLLYTPAEAARRLRVRESWLRKKAAARLVPCTHLGRHLRFLPRRPRRHRCRRRPARRPRRPLPPPTARTTPQARPAARPRLAIPGRAERSCVPTR
jgi:hypothetical protein